jgi:hypothetical protein
MKNLKYIIVPALAAFMFTACKNEVKGPTQAEIDTQVELKVKAATDQLKADCDSRIMQAAQLKADSILAKTASQQVEVSVPVAKPVAPKPITNTTTPKVTTSVKKTETVGNGKPKMGTNSSTSSKEVGDGKPKMGNEDAKGKTDDKKVGNGKPKMGE